MVIELEKMGLKVEPQKQLLVHYDGEILGEYFVDILVNEAVIIELKATKELSEAHRAQLLTYLKASEIEVGLLLNFGPKSEYERKAMDNHRKGSLTWTSQNKA